MARIKVLDANYLIMKPGELSEESDCCAGKRIIRFSPTKGTFHQPG